MIFFMQWIYISQGTDSMFQDKLLLKQQERLMWQHGLGTTKSDKHELA